jgi:hypothetical protein
MIQLPQEGPAPVPNSTDGAAQPGGPLGTTR